MASMREIQEAVEGAQQLLAQFEIPCTTTPEELGLWFEADTLYPDDTLDQVLESRLIVVHELIEIQEVKKASLELTKDVILNNLDTVDCAHLLAAEIEMDIAQKLCDVNHLRSRIRDIEKWCVDESVSEANRKKYRIQLHKTRSALAQIEGKTRKGV